MQQLDVDARSELFEFAVRSGLKVLESMFEEDRTALCGPRYPHLTARRASRGWHGKQRDGGSSAGRWRCAGRGCAPRVTKCRCPRSERWRTSTV
jgi:hypothetical protein